jgi:hypothetical protein
MERGHPPLYKTSQELSEKIQEYFLSLEYTDSVGDVKLRAPSVSGMAYYLGYDSRQSIYDQKGRGEDFSYVLRRAVVFIESYHEIHLTEGRSATGAIFWLKNHGWTDAQEIKQTGNRDPININFGEMIADMSNQEVFDPE